MASKTAEFKDQFGLKETLLSIKLQPHSDAVPDVLTAESSESLLSLLLLVPHGVAKMSHAVEGKKKRPQKQDSKVLGVKQACFARLLDYYLTKQAPVYCEKRVSLNLRFALEVKKTSNIIQAPQRKWPCIYQMLPLQANAHFLVMELLWARRQAYLQAAI